MSIIAPLNFLFAGLLGFIVLLYMLRLKRKERVVPSTLLWQSALRDLQANAPWQKLRSSLLMWLQLAFLTLAVLALVRPAIKVFASGGQTVAVIIDSSASMKATDVSPSRYEKARSQAGDLINRLSTNDMGTVISAGLQTRVLAPLTTDKNVLKRAVSRAKAQDAGSDLREAIVLASSLLRGKKNPQIYVLSDGAVTPLQDLNIGNIGLQFVKFGQRADNIAITAMDARRGLMTASNQTQVFVTLTNFGPRERKVSLELSRDGDLLEVRPITVPPASEKNGDSVPGQASELFDGLPFDSGLFSAKFDADDDLASDNVGFARLDAPRPIRVLMTADDPFLEKALNVDPNVRLFRGSGGNGDFDVVVCEDTVPANLPVTNQFIFNATTDLTPVTVVGEAPQPGVADFDGQHPVVRFAPWSDLKFVRSMAVKVKAWGKPVVEAERTPLVVAGERDGRRVVWCGFGTQDTDMPLKITFPIFVSNTLRWLTAPRGAAGTTEGAPLRAGQPVPLVPPASTKEVTVVAPDKTVRRIPTGLNADTVLYDGADQVGLYSASSGDWKQTFAVSLLNKNESDITPRDALRMGDQKKVLAESHARANRELWGIIMAVALLILGAEWWVYHRGV